MIGLLEISGFPENRRLFVQVQGGKALVGALLGLGFVLVIGQPDLPEGLAILAGVRARLAALLLTVMYASFTPLVHLPMLLADPASHGEWSENALNLALTAVAWVVWDSLACRRIADA